MKAFECRLLHISESRQCWLAPVLSESRIGPNSSRFAMIVAQQTTKPFTTAHEATAPLRPSSLDKPADSPPLSPDCPALGAAAPDDTASLTRTPGRADEARRAGLRGSSTRDGSRAVPNRIEPKSSRTAMIVAQQATKPFTPPDGANGAAPSVVIGRPQLLRRNQPVAQPLVRPLEMIVRHVLGHELAPMTLA
jgi:hypothetical protein